MPVLATWSPLDAALDILLPLGLVASTGSGLVIDLDPEGPRLGPGPTLADLVRSGPTLEQLEPPQTARTGKGFGGKASGFLSNGGVNAGEATPVVAAMIERWPSVVLRCSPRDAQPPGSIAALPLLPEPFTPVGTGRVVYQRCAFSPRRKPEGVVLPIPRRRTVEALFAGRRPPSKRDPWLRAVARLWSLP